MNYQHPPFPLTIMFWFAALMLSSNGLTSENRKTIADFSRDGLSQWKHQYFHGKSHYELTELEGQRVLKASSHASASALYRKVTIDLNKTPKLSWSWRLDQLPPVINPLKKAEDDYPARVYVVKKGFFPWEAKAINYVWANIERPKAYWPNPFSDNAIMIPIRTGSEGLGLWHWQTVDVKADFKRLFNLTVDSIDGVAIMSDSDNTKGRSQAYFGEFYFSP